MEVRKDTSWHDEQVKFVEKCLRLMNRLKKDTDLRMQYSIHAIDMSHPQGIRQPFRDSYIFNLIDHRFCHEDIEELADYGLNHLKNNAMFVQNELPKLEKSLRWEKFHKPVISIYISGIKKEYPDTKVLILDSGRSKEFNDFHLKNFITILDHYKIPYQMVGKNFVFEGRHFVVVEFISDNTERVKDICKRILETNNKPLITYISMFKGSSSEEVFSVINQIKKKKLIEQESEEAKIIRKAKEEEQRRKNKKAAQEELAELKKCVSSWNHSTYADCTYFSMYYYYPTTCDFEADWFEWDIRKLVWAFKNDPNRTEIEEHEEAENRVLNLTQKVLRYYFGDLVDRLTFVCVPASKEYINALRYEHFSYEICKRMDMWNAYKHIHFKSDGDAKHLGGTEKASISFDEDFFKGKYVVMFDDIITSGKSMERMKKKLESFGAVVLGGISIGKTKHERVEGMSQVRRLIVTTI